MGKRRIRNLQYLGYKDILAFEPKEERRLDAETKYNVRTFSNFEDAIKQKPDAIIISTPPNLHTVYSKKAAELGIHFFVEASVINDGLEEVDRIAKSKGIVAAPSCTMRFKQSIMKMKELISKGSIGKVLGFTYHLGQYLPDWHPWEDISKFYVGRRETGAAREMVCFESEWLTWLFGDVEKIACIKGKFSDMGVDIDDVYAMIYQFKGKLVGTVMVDVVSRVPYRTIRIIGSEGNIVWDWDSATVRMYTASNKSWVEFKETEKIVQEGYWAKDDMYIEEMRCFVDSITGEKPYPYSLSDDIKILGLLIRAEQSSDEGKHIKFS